MNTLSVILIDDEVRAIQALSRILAQFPEVRVVATFDDALAAFEYLQFHDVDGVFADIEMPELNGLEFAEALLSLKPNIHIVFTTAYAEYAVKAFELASLDYLLKPVQMERMSKTIARMMYAATRRSSNGFLVRTTPTLALYDTFGQPLVVRWRTERAKQVFVYLLLHANQAVPRDILLDVFWEGYDQTKAVAQLYTTMYLIRKTLGPIEDDIQLQTGNGMYTLHVPIHRVDVLEFRALVRRVTDSADDFDVKEIRDLRMMKSDVLIDITDVWIEPFRALIDRTKEDFIIMIMSRYATPKQMNTTLRSACRLLVADFLESAEYDTSVLLMLKRGLALNGIHNVDHVMNDFIAHREQ